jgi:predicted DNA-binding transcriptional regulator AlpA
MTLQILQITDVMALLKVSRPTVDRWVAESRAGKNDFPVPFTPPSRKLLWTSAAIEEWINSRQSTTTPQAYPTTSAKERKREERAYRERQQRAEAALERHRPKKTKPTKAS